MSVLTQNESKLVENAISEAEKRTSGEIVVAVVPHSGLYRWLYGVCVGLGWAMGSLAAWMQHASGWGPSGVALIAWQASSILALFFLIQIPGIRRLFLSKKEMAERVHQRAIQLFVQSGTLKTQDRTGVLIYVSELEHRVEILADVGIHSRVGDDYWKQQVDLIVLGIRKKTACQAICEAISQIGHKLAENFPPRGDNPNELSNQPL